MRGKSRFDVHVVFPDIAFGIKNRPDVELTPEDVCRSLEEFCARVRTNLQPVDGAADGRMSDETKDLRPSERPITGTGQETATEKVLLRCDRCGRREYARAGQKDKMTQPDGSMCGGKFR